MKVCDEGHLIKNQNGATNKAVMKINTKRRIILTGTPVQNNLNEYYAMVDWIKPALLGTVREFNNLYANPIKDGQHMDSTPQMIKRMKQRSFILNRKLAKFVQRKEATVLKEFLPQKYEYCIFVPLTPVQEKLYEHYLYKNPIDGGHQLLNDYTALRKIWTHPMVLQKAYERAKIVEQRINEVRKRSKNQVDEGDDEPDDLLDKLEGNTGVKSDWWKQFVSNDDLESLFGSNKLILLFEILRLCAMKGEKVLVFSAFVAVLNVVEEFMKKIHNCQMNHTNSQKYGYSNYAASWKEGEDYYRLDGSTKRDVRHQMIQKFNEKTNKRLRCFLISAKAGGQGINLTGANRCIILDTAWNPSADQQNIFRIYRLGQKNPCFVYRLIALGTMEEKVYSRSVTKQAMSGRVVDKLQIERHFTLEDLTKLYTLTKFDPSTRPAQIMPTDDVLKYLLHKFPEQAFNYHNHDSLLENKPEQDLNDEEINEAWQLYEAESKGPIARVGMPSANDPLRPDFLSNMNYMPSTMDTTTNLFKQLYSPYFPNDYIQSLMTYDMSRAYNQPLASPSPNTIPPNASGSSLLRNQLATTMPLLMSPMRQFANSTASTSKTSTIGQRSQKSPSLSNNQNHPQQNRSNGAIRTSESNRQNNSVNLSILPDKIDLIKKSTTQVKRIPSTSNTVAISKNRFVQIGSSLQNNSGVNNKTSLVPTNSSDRPSTSSNINISKSRTDHASTSNSGFNRTNSSLNHSIKKHISQVPSTTSSIITSGNANKTRSDQMGINKNDSVIRNSPVIVSSASRSFQMPSQQLVGPRTSETVKGTNVPTIKAVQRSNVAQRLQQGKSIVNQILKGSNLAAPSRGNSAPTTLYYTKPSQSAPQKTSPGSRLLAQPHTLKTVPIGQMASKSIQKQVQPKPRNDQISIIKLPSASVEVSKQGMAVSMSPLTVEKLQVQPKLARVTQPQQLFSTHALPKSAVSNKRTMVVS